MGIAMFSYSKRGLYSFSGKSFAFACVILVILALIDGLMPQVQMIATGGHVFIPTVLVKFALYALILTAAIWQWKSAKLTRNNLIWFLVTFYLVADAFFLLFYLHLS